MYAKYYIIRRDTAESERINFVDGNARPDFQLGKSNEARTYQTEQQYDAIASDGKGGILFMRFAFIPPMNDVGFPAHVVNIFWGQPLGLKNGNDSVRLIIFAYRYWCSPMISTNSYVSSL